MVVAVVVGYPLMRLSGNYVAVATMGFLIIVYTVLIQWDSVTYGSQGLNPIPTYTNVWSAYFWAVLTIYVAWRIRRSSFGRSMIASRDNLIAARAVGVRVHRARLLAFTVCGFLTGVGWLLARSSTQHRLPQRLLLHHHLQHHHHGRAGWAGQLTGAIFGAIFMTLAPELLRNLETNVTIGPIHWDQAFGLQQIILALIFIAVMILRPSGLMAGREIDLAWWQNRRRAQSERPQ